MLYFSWNSAHDCIYIDTVETTLTNFVIVKTTSSMRIAVSFYAHNVLLFGVKPTHAPSCIRSTAVHATNPGVDTGNVKDVW